ncbi:hypothetical protein QM565_01270 [Geitlerinema splendidum]|jgi:hypothetical protein|nr:hypothetical protein [Geitlerinema splendidum]
MSSSELRRAQLFGFLFKQHKKKHTMTYSKKMSLAVVTIGALIFVYSSNCEAKIGTFPEHYSCEDIVGTGK